MADCTEHDRTKPQAKLVIYYKHAVIPSTTRRRSDLERNPNTGIREALTTEFSTHARV